MPNSVLSSDYRNPENFQCCKLIQKLTKLSLIYSLNSFVKYRYIIKQIGNMKINYFLIGLLLLTLSYQQTPSLSTASQVGPIVGDVQGASARQYGGSISIALDGELGSEPLNFGVNLVQQSECSFAKCYTGEVSYTQTKGDVTIPAPERAQAFRVKTNGENDYTVEYSKEIDETSKGLIQLIGQKFARLGGKGAESIPRQSETVYPSDQATYERATVTKSVDYDESGEIKSSTDNFDWALPTQKLQGQSVPLSSFAGQVTISFSQVGSAPASLDYVAQLNKQIDASPVSQSSKEIEAQRSAQASVVIGQETSNYEPVIQYDQPASQQLPERSRALQQFSTLSSNNRLLPTTNLWSYSKVLYDRIIWGRHFTVTFIGSCDLITGNNGPTTVTCTAKLVIDLLQITTKTITLYTISKSFNTNWNWSQNWNLNYPFTWVIPMPPPVSFITIQFQLNVGVAFVVGISGTTNNVPAPYIYRIRAVASAAANVNAIGVVDVVIARAGVQLNGVLASIGTDPTLDFRLEVPLRKVTLRFTWNFYVLALNLTFSLFYQLRKWNFTWGPKHYIQSWTITAFYGNWPVVPVQYIYINW